MPFTVEQFLEVFADYNRAVYPAQLILVLAALVAIFLAIKAGKNSDKFVSAILVLLWIWMGVAYHLVFFSRINRAALFFGAVFILQAAVFFFAGVLGDKLSFQFRYNTASVLGIFLIVYALLIYPLFGFVVGHVYPRSPTFGLPCPTTIYTFGLLLWTNKKTPWYVLPIPFLWSLVGFSAALSLEIYEDFALPVAGIVGTALLLWQFEKNFNNKDSYKKMKQKIVGFDLDDEGEWRAKLNCGHHQHVRHKPPLTIRDWVLTEEGRSTRLGAELDCKKCDEEA